MFTVVIGLKVCTYVSTCVTLSVDTQSFNIAVRTMKCQAAVPATSHARPRSLPNRIDDGGRYKTCPGAPVEKERTEIAFCGFAHNKEGPSSWRRLDALPLLLTSCPGMHV